jgi:phage repressor protein C with HTH and peptisase S24 domain
MSKLTDKLHAQASAVGVSQADIARSLGVSQQAINNLFNGRAASSSYWREIAGLLHINEDEMRQLMIDAGNDPARRQGASGVSLFRFPKENHSQATTLPPPPSEIKSPEIMNFQTTNKMLPVLGEAVGGDDGRFVFNGQILDYVACPPSLANVPNAYSVYVDGESMSPRFRPGETVYVHPTKPARRGDDVIVQIHPPSDDGSPPWGYIKEFVGWQGTKLVLQQYNPNKRIEFERNEVVSVHPIILSGKYA